MKGVNPQWGPAVMYEAFSASQSSRPSPLATSRSTHAQEAEVAGFHSSVGAPGTGERLLTRWRSRKAELQV